MKNLAQDLLKIFNESSEENTSSGEETTSRYLQIGEQIIELFGLKIKNGRVDTSWGNKTVEGLGKVIERIIEEAK